MSNVPAERSLKTVLLPSLRLESGLTLSDVAVAYHDDGPVGAPVVVVLHGLTGSADAVGDWWRLVAGPGAPIDTDRVRVIAPNLLGSCYGSAGPTTDPRFPKVTTRDQAAAVAGLLDTLDISHVALATGVSLGAMVALELAVSHPSRVGYTSVIAAPAAHTAWAIGLNSVQRAALDALGGGRAGLALARQIAMLSYRAEPGLEDRFGRTTEGDDEWRVAGWLAAHGERLVARFDPASYRTLLDAMDSHDIGRGRGGGSAALATLGGRVTGIAISTDVLYSPDVVRQWTDAAGGHFELLVSPHGHDGFLIDQRGIGRLIARDLARALDPAAGPLRPTPARAQAPV
jgi:homoserine O-acetyltransferase